MRWSYGHFYGHLDIPSLSDRKRHSVMATIGDKTDRDAEWQELPTSQSPARSRADTPSTCMINEI